MKKLYSLIRACMTNDMNIFKISHKKNNKKSSVLVPIFLALYLMFMVWGSANSLFEKLAPNHLQYIVLSLFIFSVSVMTIIEGIYKVGSLVFNCKDDDLLLSLPIKRSTVLFIRLFKFYVFELLFNSIFILPVMIAYIRWAENLTWAYFLTSFIMLLLLPIIPIIISSIIGIMTSSISSKFKYKNATEIIISMIILVGILYLSYNTENIFNYLVKNANNINGLITKLYYPAGIYAKLVINFNITQLLIFIFINIELFIILIYLLGKIYFKINSRLKKVSTTKKLNIKDLSFRSNKPTITLIKKELNTFFKTPVFFINAGFALVLFILVTIAITIKFDSIMLTLVDPNGFNLTKELIMSNLSIVVLLLILVTAFMTSITNSVISLEGKNINILKSLPISIKTILMSKVYAGLVLTTPVFLIGDIILFIRFKISLLESFLLIIISILVPLASHFIGLIVNLKYPKLDAENSTEVVKQSTSSIVSVMIGILLLLISVGIITSVIGKINSSLLLIIVILVFIIVDLILYSRLIKKGVKDFSSLTV